MIIIILGDFVWFLNVLVNKLGYITDGTLRRASDNYKCATHETEGGGGGGGGGGGMTSVSAGH